MTDSTQSRGPGSIIRRRPAKPAAATTEKHPLSKEKTDAGIESRRTALGILTRVNQHSAFADVLLGARLPDLDGADRALVTRLVLGAIAWRGRLDYEIERLASRAIDEIDPAVLEILRLGLFQLRFLDRVPAYAAVDTSVGLARETKAARNASGFVNAILRKATRGAVELPDRSANEIRWLAIRWSHPAWLVEKFVNRFGVVDAESIMAANNEAAPTAIRLNLARGARDEIAARIRNEGMDIALGAMAETAVVTGALRFDSESFRAGLWHPQSEASQMVSRLLAPSAGAEVADVAAAPGGKATHLAELVGPRGRVIALDANLAGLRNARAIAKRLGHDNIRFARADITKEIPLRPASFDFILLDAPCTGTGTMREHPEIRWRLKPDDFPRMARIQSAMLAKAAQVVRSGGAIVYSVCSLAPEEGIEVVREFVATHADFAIDANPPVCDFPAGVVREGGTFATRPDRGGLDGFFAARIVRIRKP
ncbi:MAG TPA: 16S rRNA (cytosine(967)-C(5))-methyltransferase RsmB [Candidatus Binataceae bacterium]|nr:16S rRNA (cytosine(967)-C(5))-methyltransferase RsmB [Candidatus Binataceae bacterium]